MCSVYLEDISNPQKTKNPEKKAPPEKKEESLPPPVVRFVPYKGRNKTDENPIDKSSVIDNLEIDEKLLSNDGKKFFKDIEKAKKEGFIISFNRENKFYEISYQEKKYLITGRIYPSASFSLDLEALAIAVKRHQEKPPIIIYSKDNSFVTAVDRNCPDYETFNKAKERGYKIYLEREDDKSVTFQAYKVTAGVETKLSEGFSLLKGSDKDYLLERNAALARMAIQLLKQSEQSELKLPKPINKNDDSKSQEQSLKSHNRILPKESDSPELYKLISQMSARGYELWVRDFDGKEITFDFIDKGNKTQTDRKEEDRLEYLGKSLSFKIPVSSYNDVEYRENKLVETVKSKLSKDKEYSRRDDLVINLRKSYNNEDILNLVELSTKLDKKALNLGEETKFSTALSFILEKYSPSDNQRMKLLETKMPLLHNLQRIHNYDKNFLASLQQQGKLVDFCFGLLDFISDKRLELGSEVILDRNSKLIVLLGDENIFDRRAFEGLAERFGLKKENLLIFKAEAGESKENNEKRVAQFLQEVNKAALDKKQQTVIWTYGHGSSDSDTVLFAEDKNKSTNSVYLTLEALKKALTDNQVNLNNQHLTLMFDQCYSYDLSKKHSINLSSFIGNEREGKQNYLPGVLISASLRGNVSWASSYSTNGMTDSSLTKKISLLLPSAETALYVNSLFRIDARDTKQNTDTASEGWFYRIMDSGERYFSKDDITVYDNKFIQTYQIIDEVTAKLRNKNIKIESTTIRSDDLAPAEVAGEERGKRF